VEHERAQVAEELVRRRQRRPGALQLLRAGAAGESQACQLLGRRLLLGREGTEEGVLQIVNQG
jgi:hypothetical protein